MREYELEVLDQYDMEVISTHKIRGAYFCDTNEGTMLLKETKVSDRRALLLYTVLCRLSGEGDENVDLPVFNKEGALVSVSRDQRRYMLKKWFGGRECDVRRESDVLEMASNLAKLHLKMEWRDTGNVYDGREIIPPRGRRMKEEFISHTRELKKIRSYVRAKADKGDFEYLFLDSFERMYDMALYVMKRMEESGYDELYKESISQQKLIHGDYNYHNVMFLTGNVKQQAIATTNFEHLRIDVQVQDLYYFLRKVMEKYHWKETVGRSILEMYGRIRPLTEQEMEFLALKLAFPEKFWKTADAYYQSNKVWIPEKSVEKLQVAIRQTDEKMCFLEKIFAFLL